MECTRKTQIEGHGYKDNKSKSKYRINYLACSLHPQNRGNRVLSYRLDKENQTPREFVPLSQPPEVASALALPFAYPHPHLRPANKCR